MRHTIFRAIAVLVIALGGAVAEAATTTQTIVFFRHGEKPSGGYGQLTCQGFNRAIELTDVLVSRFGPPTYLFAPNPLPKMTESAGTFFYVRPLATIEPTAIKLRIAVNARYGYNDISGLTSALTQSGFAGSTTFVAWEHAYLVKAVQLILNKYKAGITAPTWTSGDYDALYIVRLTNTNGYVTATFKKDFEGLNNRSTNCPS
jgi:hypothetical protein